MYSRTNSCLNLITTTAHYSAVIFYISAAFHVTFNLAVFLTVSLEPTKATVLSEMHRLIKQNI